MNLFGYTLLWDGKTEEALEIFKQLVTDYPNSSNTYDSLAEAYQKLGNNEKAILNYEKSLSIDPDNFNAEDQIDRINNPNKKKPSPEERFYQKNTIKEYRADLDQLGNCLLYTSPSPRD